MTTNSTSLAENKSSSSVTQIVHPVALEKPLPTLEHSLTVKLNHDNYLVWRKQTLDVIIGNGLKDMMDGSRPCPPQVVEGSNEDSPDFTGWHEHNQLIMSWIVSTLSEGFESQIKGHETAYAVWTELEKLFSADLRKRGMKLRRKFRKTRKGSSSVEEFIKKIKEICDCLKEIGENVTEYEQIIHLLGGLGTNYEDLIDQVALKLGSISLEEIHRMLLEFDRRLKDTKPESSSSKLPDLHSHIKSGFSGLYGTPTWYIKLDDDDESSIDLPQASAGPSRPHPSLSTSSDFSNLECEVCGGLGHTARTCQISRRRRRRRRRRGQASNSSEDDFSINVAEVGEGIPESLNSSNYADWSGRVRTYLQERKVWYVIETPREKKTKKDNDIALDVINLACGFPTNLCITDIKSARTAWETLAINCKLNETAGVDVERFLKAGQLGDWKTVEHFLHLDPNLATARIPHSGSTVLHLAALAGEEEIVEKMVGLMKEEDLEIRGTDGYTALANASAIGNTRIAKCIVEKHKILLSIPIAGTGSELLPVVIAVKYGHKQTALYLYSVTPQEDLSPDGGKINGAALLTYSIRRQYYDITFGLIRRCPRLAIASDHYGQSPLYQLACTPSAFPNASGIKFWQRWIYNFVSIQEIDYASNNVILNVQDVEDSPGVRQRIVSSLQAVLGIKKVYEMKVLHLQSLGLVHLICQQMKTLGRNPNAKKDILDSLHEAIARGIVEFIVGVLKVFPECIWLRDEDEATIFMKAVKFREAKVFSLIHGFTSKERIAALVDYDGHNILHKAGLVDEYSEDKIRRIQGAALQMQSELQWFEEIEKMTSSDRLDLKNNNGDTARQLFTDSHNELMRNAEKWMKNTSNSCIIVGILVVTIMFAAAFTVPGGNQQDTGFPIFLKKKLFKIFIISDAVSLFSSTTSVLMFMGILTSRYAEQDFLKSLPSKMIIGLSTLFLSLATMMIAFTATLLIMLHTESWIIIPIVLLASLPVTLYVRLLYPLLYELLMSTYGPSIFDRKCKWSLIG